MTVVKSAALLEDDQARAHEVEGVIREFAQRDGTTPRQLPPNDVEVGGDNISVLLQRMAGASLQQMAFASWSSALFSVCLPSK